MSPEQILARADEGLPKLWLIRQTLKARHERKLFQPQDSYRALTPSGAKREHIIAFARNQRAVTVVPRFDFEARRRVGRHRHRNPQRTLAQSPHRRNVGWRRRSSG